MWVARGSTSPSPEPQGFVAQGRSSARALRVGARKELRSAQWRTNVCTGKTTTRSDSIELGGTLYNGGGVCNLSDCPLSSPRSPKNTGSLSLKTLVRSDSCVKTCHRTMDSGIPATPQARGTMLSYNAHLNVVTPWDILRRAAV